MNHQHDASYSKSIEKNFPNIEMHSSMEALNNKPKSFAKQVSDTNNLAYILHFVLGAGNLLPWNALITAVDYFGVLYPGKHVEKVFSVVYMTSSLLVLVLLLCWGCSRKSSNLRCRMNVGFSMFFCALIAIPIMQWICHKNESLMSSNGGFNVVVGAVLTCGIADGLIGGSLIGTAGKLPKKYMQAVFAGTASSGVLISVLRIITKASFPQTKDGMKTSAKFYFLISSSILIGCIISCNVLYKLPVMHEHYKNTQTELPTHKIPTPKFWETFTKMRFPGLGIFMIYTVTLSIFPGFLAENIKSEFLKDWYPVLLITTYNVSDFGGKLLTGLYVMEDIGKATWGCVARLLFYPLFIGCFRGPEWLKTDVPVVVLTVLLGLSNGYLTSVLMILTPKTVPPSEAEVVAIVMVVLLGVGLVVGSVVGWFWII